MEKKNELLVKTVNFNGTDLIAVHNEDDDKIYVGVKWICEGLGLSEGQIKNERLKIQSDLVLKQGGRNLILPTNSGEQDVLVIELDFLPLWLAKISITPKMQENNPKLVENLIEYQLKAKDILAKAFINNDSIEKLLKQIYDGGSNAISATKQIVELEVKPLKEEIEEMKPLSEFAKQVSEAENCIEIGQMAKLLYNKNTKIGSHRLFKFLKNQKVLRDNNDPYQKYLDNGWFDVVEVPYLKKGIKFIGLKTVCTGKGQQKIYELVKDKYVK